MKKNFDLQKDNLPELQNINFEKDGDVLNIMDIQPDPDILRLARAYDDGVKRKQRTQRRKRFAHVAALVLVCLVGVSTITLESSDALKMQICRYFFNEEEGSATFLTEDEYALIGDWEDYWYPTYLPEGFLLTRADKSDSEKIMLFSSENGEEIRIIERDLAFVTAIDTDHTSVEEIRVGYHQGYFLMSEEYDFMSVCWTTDDRQLNIETNDKIDRDMLMEVAENLSYRKDSME